VLDCFDTISFSGFHRMDNLLKCHIYALPGQLHRSFGGQKAPASG